MFRSRALRGDPGWVNVLPRAPPQRVSEEFRPFWKGVHKKGQVISEASNDAGWRKSVGVEPTRDRWQPLPGLKPGRPTGGRSSSLDR